MKNDRVLIRGDPRALQRIYAKRDRVVQDAQLVDVGQAVYWFKGEQLVEVVIRKKIFTPESVRDDLNGTVLVIIGQPDATDGVLR